MTLIGIEECPLRPDGSNATVSFDHGPLYSITVQSPFSQQEEEALEWYFEKYLQMPFMRKERAARAADSIAEYGEELFKQVFADFKVYAAYMECVKAGLNTLQIEVVGSPTFHKLHWEAIKDPNFRQPLVLQARMVRKNPNPPALDMIVRSSPTINVLFVISRPSVERDVGYRTISRPIVESLRQVNLPVKLDILRPGTYEALDNHLRQVSAKHGIGYYHIIHFDVHGALLSYDEYKSGCDNDRYICQNRYGRDDIPIYEGKKAFLSLEDRQDYKADLIEALEIAELLITHQIPITIINACESAKVSGTSEINSLGSLFMQAGVRMVLAVAYTVTVSAAEIFMSTLYKQFFASQDLLSAICHARHELYNRKGRRAYFDQEIDLEDWVLPVVYQNQDIHLNVRTFSMQEAMDYYSGQAVSYSPQQPQYGFVGRDIDILRLEKRLLTKRNLVLISGIKGIGKTSLLAHAGNWWQATGFVEHVFEINYEKRLWTHQEIMSLIAQQLLSPVQFHEVFQNLPAKARQAMLNQHLRSQRHLLILDNLEAISEIEQSIGPTLSQEEQVAIHDFLGDLVGGRTLVILSSSDDESWLAQGTFNSNVYNLDELDPEAASTLADRILERIGATKYRQDEDLRKLLKALRGVPFLLEQVLPRLANQTPSELLADLQVAPSP